MTRWEQGERARIAASSKLKTGVRYRSVAAIPEAPLPEAIAKLCPGEDDRATIAGANAIVRRGHRYGAGKLVLIAGKAHTTHAEEVYGACLARAGDHAYAVASNRITVFRTDLTAPSIFTVFDAPDRLEEVALVDDRYLFAGGSEGTHVVDLEATERGAFDKLAGIIGCAGTSSSLGTVLDGRVVWHAHAGFRKTTFATIHDGKLVRLATLDLGAEVIERDGQLYGRTAFHTIAIDGVAEALTQVTKPGAAKKARTAKKPTLELREIAEQPPYPAPTEDWTKKVRGTLVHYRTGVRTLGWDGKVVRWLDDAGELRTYAPDGALVAYDADAHGRIAIATYHDVALVDANTGEAAKIATLKDYIKGVACAADGLIAVLGARDLQLLGASGRALHRVALGHTMTLWPVRDGRLLGVTSTWCKYRIEVFSVEKNKLVRRFRSPIETSQAYAVGDRYVVQATTARWFELTG